MFILRNQFLISLKQQPFYFSIFQVSFFLAFFKEPFIFRNDIILMSVMFRRAVEARKRKEEVINETV